MVCLFFRDVGGCRSLSSGSRSAEMTTSSRERALRTRRTPSLRTARWGLTVILRGKLCSTSAATLCREVRRTSSDYSTVYETRTGAELQNESTRVNPLRSVFHLRRHFETQLEARRRRRVSTEPMDRWSVNGSHMARNSIQCQDILASSSRSSDRISVAT